MQSISLKYKFQQEKILVLLVIFSVMLSSCSVFRRSGSSSSGKELASVSRSKKVQELSIKLGIEPDEKANVRLLEISSEWLGAPYKYGGCTKDGTDCSGFVSEVYKQVYNKTLPRSCAEQFKNSAEVKDQFQEGDLLFFKTEGNKISHVGVYLSNGKFIHASTSKGVMVDDLSSAYYKKHFVRGGRP